jgi:predicted porin
MRVTVFRYPLTQNACLGSPRPRLRILAVRGVLVPRFLWGTYVKRTFISAAAVLAFAAAGHADELSDIQAQAKQLREQNQAMTKRLADLEKRQKALETRPAVSAANPVDSMAADLPYKAAVKAKPLENDDLCWHGVCLYGNFDGGLSYNQHGAPFSSLAGGPLDYLVSKNGNGAYFGFGANMLSTSFIGLRGKQEIAEGLYGVFNFQTLFNSANGNNADGIGSIVQNNGLTGNLAAQNAFGDSSKSGQMFNNVAYAGISSPVWGTVTYGRQSALSSDLVVNYDPLSGSNAWSVITFQGANGGGGVTENRIYDNSFEYRVNVGPARFAVETQLRNGGNSGTGNAFEGNVGFDYMGFSVDFLGGKIYDSVSSGILSAAQLTALDTSSISFGKGWIAATVSDNTVFQVGAKYTLGPWKFFGGYEHIDFNNPNNPLLPGAFDQGGYIGGAVNNLNFITTKTLQTAWVGVRYAITPTLDITGAYYHEWQNSFVTSANSVAAGAGTLINNGAVIGAGQNVGGNCTDARSSACSGTLDAVSLVIDWRFARHVDVFAGVMWSQVQGGLANGFLQTNPAGNGAAVVVNGVLVSGNKANTFDPGIGVRYQF